MKLSFTLSLFVACLLFCSLQTIVQCQYATKSIYYTSAGCTGVNYHTAYTDSSVPCKPDSPPRCNVVDVVSPVMYWVKECVSSIPPVATLNNIHAYIYYNTSCTGAIKSLQVSPINQCIPKFGTPYFITTDGSSMFYYYDNLCTKSMMSTPLFIDSCLPFGTKYTSLVSNNPQPQPQPKQQYQRNVYYNTTSSGVSSCSASLFTEFYRVATDIQPCSTGPCEKIDFKVANSETYSQTSECTTIIPSSPSVGYFHISSHVDQTSCLAQQSPLQLEIYPLDKCSPYLAGTNSTGLEQTYIKSEGCKYVRRYNDSSCLNAISQIDLSSSVNTCNLSGIKYMCNSNSGTIVGGTNSTRMNDGVMVGHNSKSTVMFLLGIILVVLVSIL